MSSCSVIRILLIGSLAEIGRSVYQTVHTRNSDIQGILRKGRGRSYAHAYLGVPYAIPPVGDLRYRPPVPISRWQGSVNAIRLGNTCYSAVDRTFPGFPGSEMWNPPTELSEDCLNLNIWVPADVDPKSEKLPVVVWIFGGGFYSGSPSLDLYDGLTLATENNVIVVNINYRLGPFGFLYLGRETSAPGNMGLLDQQLALRWVQENIEHFGGDSGDVSLFGESAGAASVSAHLLSPGSANLFHKAILQSGSIINQWAHVSCETMLRRSRKMAEKLNCDDRNTAEEIAECLRGKTAADIQKSAEKMNHENRFLEFSFVPMDSDGIFFTQDISVTLADGTFKKCPIIVGLVSQESTFWLPYYLPGIIKFDPDISKFNQKSLLTRTEYSKAVNTTFQNYFPSILGKSIAYHYSDDLKIAQEGRHEASFRNSVSRMISDYFFECDVIQFAEILAEHGSQVYFYVFTQRSSVNPWPTWMGTMHGYEIEYFFGVPIRNESAYTPEEVRFSRRIMNMWLRFPSTTKSWPLFTKLQKKYLILSAENNSVLSFNDNDNCKFWTDVKTANNRLTMTKNIINSASQFPVRCFLTHLLLLAILYMK